MFFFLSPHSSFPAAPPPPWETRSSVTAAVLPGSCGGDSGSSTQGPGECQPVCACVILHVCGSVHPPHAFHRHTVRLTAGRPRMRAAPSPRFSPDASLEHSHYTHTHTSNSEGVGPKGMKAHDAGWSTLSQTNNVHFADTHFWTLDHRRCILK